MRFHEEKKLLSMTPTPTATPTPVPGWSAQDTLDDASSVLVNITQDTIDILIWVVVVLAPVGIVIGLVLWGARWFMKKITPKDVPDTPTFQ
jgi:hypothetical protein